MEGIKVIAGYGKIKRHLKNIYDSSELSELSGENLLDILQNGELLKNKITTFVALATDYAAVGQDSKLLREAMNQSSEKVNFVLIAETEALLATKAPTNKNIVVVIEKSKKAEVLKKIIDKHIAEVVQDVENNDSLEEEISSEEIKQDKVDIEEYAVADSLDEKVEIKEEQKIQVELKKTEQMVTYKKEENNCPMDNMNEKENNQVMDNTEEKISAPLFSFPLAELPEYKPLVLNKPEDIISYLMHRWR